MSPNSSILKRAIDKKKRRLDPEFIALVKSLQADQGRGDVAKKRLYVP